MFSVIIPTRDRPEALDAAIDSVLSQDSRDKEVIVLDDGSSPDNRARLDALKGKFASVVEWRHLPRLEHGHGHAFVRNLGARVMSGQYWCGLDDDDIWIDCAYLSRAKEPIEVAPLPIDAYFAQQRVIADGAVLEKQLLGRGNWYLCYTESC